MRAPTVGVYVHVPFCERICPYCDFAVVRAGRRLDPALEERTVRGLLAELALRRADFDGLALDTIYFGGGTPSLLEPGSVARLVEAACEAFAAPTRDALEVTLEVNPSTVERARLPGFREAGVSRLSIGVQSFDDEVLHRLGRAHRAGEARATLDAARAAGFDNVSLDLIFAAPGQRLAGLERDLEQALAFGPRHVSAYGLTIEPGTPFARAAARGQLALPDEDEAVAMIERIEACLGEAGLDRYEISSFAIPGFESRHNRRYWERTPVLGLGVGAVSCDPGSSRAPHGARRTNLRALPAWLERVEAGRTAEAEPPEVLDAATARGEAMFLGLRTRAGVDARGFAQEFGAPPRSFFGGEIERLVDAGLLDEAPAGELRLTRRGRLLSDSVFERFVGGGESPREPREIDGQGARW
ncbi:MAG TPA: radical SAM family heme chaperone HemW [Myxococcota bacterium]|nr:radical SAM family heme chaperone HemW [Myxococcota bacterium]